MRSKPRWVALVILLSTKVQIFGFLDLRLLILTLVLTILSTLNAFLSQMNIRLKRGRNAPRDENLYLRYPLAYCGRGNHFAQVDVISMDGSVGKGDG